MSKIKNWIEDITAEVENTTGVPREKWEEDEQSEYETLSKKRWKELADVDNRCKYCKEKLMLGSDIIMRCKEGLFCSWDCFELWEVQEKLFALQDNFKDRYSEGEIKLTTKLNNLKL